MSQQGPIVIIADAERPSFAAALDDAKLFPVIDVRWADVPSYRVEQVAFAPDTTIVRPRGDCVIFPIPSSPGEDLVVMPAELSGWTEVMESAGVRRTASEK